MFGLTVNLNSHKLSSSSYCCYHSKKCESGVDMPSDRLPGSGEFYVDSKTLKRKMENEEFLRQGIIL